MFAKPASLVLNGIGPSEPADGYLRSVPVVPKADNVKLSGKSTMEWRDWYQRMSGRGAGTHVGSAGFCRQDESTMFFLFAHASFIHRLSLMSSALSVASCSAPLHTAS
jgi:hypothetical protein